MSSTPQQPAYNIREVVYRVRSVTPGREGTVYTVREIPFEGGFECECTAAQHGRRCWHIEFVAEGVVKPTVRLTVAQPTPPAPRPTWRDLYNESLEEVSS